MSYSSTTYVDMSQSTNTIQINPFEGHVVGTVNAKKNKLNYLDVTPIKKRKYIRI